MSASVVCSHEKLLKQGKCETGGENRPGEIRLLWKPTRALLSLVKDGGAERSGATRLRPLPSQKKPGRAPPWPLSVRD